MSESEFGGGGSAQAPGQAKRKATQASYAGLFWRVPGFLVDTLVMSLLSVVAVLCGNGLWRAITSQALPIASAPVLMFLVIWLYPAVCESSRWKATIGKRVFGLRVVDVTGRRIGFRKAGLRALIRVVSWGICTIGFLMMLANRKKQTLHDWATDTVVVYVPGGAILFAPFAYLPKRVRSSLSRFAPALMALLSVFMLSGCLWAAVVLLRPTFVTAQAAATVGLTLENVRPIQAFIAERKLAGGVFPKEIDPAVLQQVSVLPGVTVRYLPYSGVLDIVFDANPLLNGRVISLAPLVAGAKVTWLCRSTGISKDILQGRCEQQ